MKRKGSLRRVKGIAMGAEGIVIRKDKGSGGNPFSAKFPKNRRTKITEPPRNPQKESTKIPPPKNPQKSQKKITEKNPTKFPKKNRAKLNQKFDKILNQNTPLNYFRNYM